MGLLAAERLLDWAAISSRCRFPAAAVRRSRVSSLIEEPPS